MKIAFRVDASVTMGSGHVMRCLTLAKALSGYAQSTFLCRSLPGNLIRFIETSGFKCIALPGKEAISESEDARFSFTNGTVYNLLIVDNYTLGETYCSLMRQYARSIMVIDDLADRNHNCDILLDQNLFADFKHRYKNLVPEHCDLLLGPHYALLRNEFYEAKAAPQENSVLVNFGGTDEANLTKKAVEALINLKNSDLSADIVVGANNPWIVGLSAMIERVPWMRLHVQCDYMANLMAKAAVMVGSGGTTHWERCSVGLPGIVITAAENQRETTAFLEEKGACVWLGDTQDADESDIQNSVALLLGNPAKRKAMSACAKQLVPDGAGTPFVVHAIKKHLRG